MMVTGAPNHNNLEKIHPYKGSDFENHYMRKNKSKLNNAFYHHKMINHAAKQEKYRNEKWGCRNER